MAGSLVDLETDVALPPSLVLDSGILIDWLTAFSLSAAGTGPLTPNQERATRLVSRLRGEGVTGAITATSAAEIFHVVLKFGYRRALATHDSDLRARYPNVRRHGWEHLFKARSDLVAQFAATMDEARRLIIAAGIVFLQPDDLGPLPAGRSLDEALVRTMERYQLDSSDAAILIEAQRAGIAAVASGDRDFHRARLDFDIYSWL